MADSTYPDCHVTTRVVHAGGQGGSELLEELKRIGVEINELGIRLLSADALNTSRTPCHWVTVELTVRNLGYPQGAATSEIYEKAAKLGLSLCPIELGPHLRLQYLDQPEGSSDQSSSRHGAPRGSITIASEPLEEDDDFPKGFYLRRIKGTLWLRGYRSGPDHVWGPEDHFIFCVASPRRADKTPAGRQCRRQ
jgi:hypothetical protein